ncbi:ECF-type sigma factor [Aquabacterium sp. OR-4]|uniref:ECF-type sigma factor n=1 Tax=Aquabacterium sp. OR-4 TaxID=2978127 RepID=UPI0021B3106A|nr:ECF-type sigma factor [Aquabacterium sp. OR-4]MDT7837830.1 ECF-type sigma factor [Aquabacterium sp. OR-4]
MSACSSTPPPAAPVLSPPLAEASPPAITQLLQAAGAGDAQAANQVVQLLYRELQQLARARLRRSGAITLLDTTALVHEGYLRWQRAQGLQFADRRHFFAYAAQAMHSVVIDWVRAREAQRRGGGAEHITLDTAILHGATAPADEILRVHEAMAELAATDARLAAVVQMRYFGGLSDAEIAEALAITERTVQRDWQKARLLLSLALK